ncbi:MAG: endonuclease NucS domain-containing protein [Phycisphaerales bacterium JB060]
MPLELGIWRIEDDRGPTRLDARRLDLERRLQDMLDQDISIADEGWMVIGREVQASGGRIDLLCLNANGDLVALELKRDLTPREVVAQALDYGSWLVDLEDDDIAAIWDAYVSRYHPEKGDQSLDQAFCERFGVTAMPDELGATTTSCWWPAPSTPAPSASWPTCASATA